MIRRFVSGLLVAGSVVLGTVGSAEAQDGSPAESAEKRQADTGTAEAKGAEREGVGTAANGGGEATEVRELPKTVVTATRTQTPVSQLTRSVSRLDRRTIEQQSAISRDLGDILGKTVPGFATSTEGTTNFTQTLRGRRFLVMIDGVPVSIPLRDSARDLKTIDPAALDRIEVIRGGTAVYGFGATGGVVNYITRDPVEEQITGFSEAGLGFSTEHPDGSVRWHTTHGASGQVGPIDFLVSAGFAQRNRFFDADGDRIPPDPLFNQGGFTDTDEWNVLGKFGLDFDDDRQRVEIMINHYDIEQDTDFVTSPGDFQAGQKATGVPGDPVGNPARTENTVVNFTYEHRDVMGSQVKLQAYYLDYAASFPIFPPLDAGSVNNSQKVGTRLTIDTPVLPETLNANVIWGVDFLNEKTDEQVVGANAAGTASLPDMKQNALAGFVQLEIPVAEIGRISAGMRHEQIWLDVPTFSGPGGTVTGGELGYNETLFNATAVMYIIDEIDLFGGFSQGFTVADAGSVLRAPASAWSGGGGSVENINPEAQEVDNYELGLRGDWGWLSGSVAGFFSESDLGTTFGSFGQVSRQEEEVWGIESSIEVDPHEQWTFGGTATWIASRTDLDGDGDLDEELPNRRVPPMKLTGFVEYRPFEWWSNRVQVLYSGDRDPDGATNFGTTGAPNFTPLPDEVDSFVIVDYYANFNVGPGNLRLGVENLLNEDYFPVAAQAFGTDSAFSKGQGRNMTVSYRIEW